MKNVGFIKKNNNLKQFLYYTIGWTKFSQSVANLFHNENKNVAPDSKKLKILISIDLLLRNILRCYLLLLNNEFAAPWLKY